ncbi:MAG TPA: DUF1552 domain-containing protein [Terriglobia bacterium]|nr:DUF1552 domain-containing protein [Terriglobia bacterium]
MIIDKKVLSRRTLLRGLGAAIALPWLDAMTPALSAAAKRPVRLGFIYVPNGIIDTSNQWTPSIEGSAFVFSPILKPLEPLRSHVLVLTGLAQVNGRALGDGPGDHARAGATWLTGAHPKKTEGAGIQAGISADQAAAAELGKATAVASLEIGLEKGGLVGACDSGYSCAYSNTLSWRTANSPVPVETNPRVVFERLFGSGDRESASARNARLREQQSILDFVRGDLARLGGGLGPADRSKLGEYMDAVRDAERRIQQSEAVRTRPDPGVGRPRNGAPEDYGEHAKLMFDLAVLGFQTDVTRVVSMMMGREGSNRPYRNLGISDGHHSITHHQNNADKIARVAKINTYHVQLLATFLDRLKSTPDGEGSLLDNAMVLYGSSISDGNAHAHHNLPLVLAGSGGGSIRPGRHVRYAKETPMNNLLVSMLDRAGVTVDKLGDSTGRLNRLSDTNG